MTGPATPRPDLTRWNRAGLERVRYIDANAVTLLEDVRAALEQKFPDFPNWQGVAADIPDPESPAERLARIDAAYGQPRQDWAYEIARAFVRGTHILTEHMDAFANEGFLSTATQWEYLRRLVSMLDYRPAPPASAETMVALLAKDDALPGEVAAGLQMKFTPPEGGPPAVFETLTDLNIDKDLNGLRLSGWGVNPYTFDPFATPADPDWLMPAMHDITAGQPALLVQSGTAEVTRVGAVRETGLDLGLPPSGTASATSYELGKTTLLADPDRVIAPRLNGAEVLAMANTDGFATGQVVAWVDGTTTGFARIAAVDAGGVRIADVTPSSHGIPAAGAKLYPARMIGNAAYVAAGSTWRFPRDTPGSIVLAPAGSDSALGTVVESPVLNGPDSGSVEAASYKTLVNAPSAHDMHYFDPDHDSALGTVAAAPSGTELAFDGGLDPLASGDMLVVEGHSGEWVAVEIDSIAEREDSFTLTLTQALPVSLRGAARLHGPFRQVLRPVGWSDNDTPVTAVELPLQTATDVLPDLLTAGRVVLVETDPATSVAKPFTARIARVVKPITDAPAQLVLDTEADKLAGYTIGTLIIRGNAVAAGHGEAKPPLVLGNGDAARTGQSFVLERKEVAFTANATLSAGVRAALEVTVGGMRYAEVSTLADSEASDPHYTVQMTEDGHLTLRFGDGFHGRRLPTGRNNVTVTFRQGTGRAGNAVIADSFEKPAVPHPLVRAIRQPLDATGGEDVENTSSIRSNAPAHLRTLDRAVSLADVEYLAASQPGVWHAKAFLNPVGAARNERIELAIVPVDDGPMGTLGTTIRDKLIGLAPPGIDFVVERFDPVPLALRVEAFIDSATHNADIVEPALREALYDALSLEQRGPGEPIYLARTYEIVEGVPGVVNSTAYLFEDLAPPLVSLTSVKLRHVARGDGGEVWAAWPTGRQAIYLTSSAAVAIEIKEVSL